MAEPAVFNWTVMRGDTFNESVTYKDELQQPHDLTGYSAKMQLRAGPGQPLIAEFSTANGRIVITGLQGLLTFDVLPADMNMVPGCYAYDLQLSLGTYTVTILKGKFTVLADITT